MSLEKFSYLDDLNESQKEAVINIEGPCMIIAGAGSGKTRVLTYRIAHLMKYHKVDPYNIIVLTFTNKAAKEMKERIEKIVGDEAKNLWMGTYHSVFARILRVEAERLDYSKNFTIYDTDDSKQLLKQIIKEMNLDDKIYKPNVIYNRISSAKNNLISWYEYQNNAHLLEEDRKNQKEAMSKIYRRYCERCFGSNAMDFDDILFNTNRLFQEHNDLLHKYQHKFKYVMIDEFQDTNISQYLIVKRLSAVYQNICVVGDDAQSIYAFRGADIRNILNMDKDYPLLKKIRLEQNYRSTKIIVKASNSIINNNKDQLKKDIWTQNEEGDLIEIIKSESDNDEGKFVASSIFETKMKLQEKNKEFAILYRTNSQSRSLEEALRKNNIQYRIYGGLSFYQRKEIKDLIAYFRFVVNPNDEQALRRIINVPKRGIGDASLEKIIVLADEYNMTIEDVLDNATEMMGARGKVINDFYTLIKSFRLKNNKSDAYETAQHIAKTSGILKELYNEKTIESMSRYENTQELLNAIKEFTSDEERKDKGLEAFLNEISLLTTTDNEDKDDDKVTLMTIHSAKGLEYSYVYVVGMEEDLFPSQMMLGSRSDLEEERRLFYVAVTRAKKKLILTYAQNRYRFGSLKSCEPSRFLKEINPELIKRTEKFSYKKDSIPTTKLSSLAKNNFSKRQIENINHTVSADFQSSDTTLLEKGMNVEHPKFGYGVVVLVEDIGNQKKAKIAFKTAGERSLLLNFAKLKII